MSDVPWTFEPFEMEQAPSWTVYDDNLARIVAVFYYQDEAEAYLAWRNERQAALQAEHDEKKNRQPPPQREWIKPGEL